MPTGWYVGKTKDEVVRQVLADIMSILERDYVESPVLQDCIEDIFRWVISELAPAGGGEGDGGARDVSVD